MKWLYDTIKVDTYHYAAKSLQSCPTLCDPIDGSPPGSPVPGILQARTLECVAISFSNAWKWKVKVKSGPTLSDLMDCGLPGSSVHGIFQARVLEWGAIALSNISLYICLNSWSIQCWEWSLTWTMNRGWLWYFSVGSQIVTNVPLGWGMVIMGVYRKSMGLPRQLSGKESACQSRRYGFNPCIGKIPWSRKWQPTSVFQSGKSHRQQILVSYSPWGHKRVRYNLETKQHQNKKFISSAQFCCEHKTTFFKNKVLQNKK